MNCKKCNASLSNEVKFCGKCGERIDEKTSSNNSVEDNGDNPKLKRFLGRVFIFNIKQAVLLGILFLLASYFIAGTIIIIGSLAYQSARDRKLGVVKNSKMRVVLEIAGLVGIFLLLILPTDAGKTPFEHPITSGGVISAWIVIAYVYLHIKKYFTGKVITLKRIVKYTGFTVIGLVALFLFVANFSATDSSLQCLGEITKLNVSQGSKTVFVKITEYRSWVGLWSDSDGSMDLEIPNEWFDYFDHVDEVGDQLQIYKTYPEKTPKGNFSKLSRALTIDTPYGLFEGACTPN